jgi:hypothetical protein
MDIPDEFDQPGREFVSGAVGLSTLAAERTSFTTHQ